MPENVGKYMRKLVIARLRETAEAARNASSAAANLDSSELEESDLDFESGRYEELNVCCHGRAAEPDVRALNLAPQRLLWLTSRGPEGSDADAFLQHIPAPLGPGHCLSWGCVHGVWVGIVRM